MREEIEGLKERSGQIHTNCFFIGLREPHNTNNLHFTAGVDRLEYGLEVFHYHYKIIMATMDLIADIAMMIQNCSGEEAITVIWCPCLQLYRLTESTAGQMV